MCAKRHTENKHYARVETGSHHSRWETDFNIKFWQTHWSVKCVCWHSNLWSMIIEPRHDKTNIMCVCPAKTQIGQGIPPVWTESSLCARCVAKGPKFLLVDSEDSDQLGWMPRLIWVCPGAQSHFVGLVKSRLIFLINWMTCVMKAIFITCNGILIN